MNTDTEPEPGEIDNKHAFSVWAEGLRVGWRCLRSDARVGVERLLLPVSYWRHAEFSYAVHHLPARAGARVLDLGSPKDLGVFLARRRGYAVRATDILPAAVTRGVRTARAAGVLGDGPGRVFLEIVDGRRLPYADSTFDAAYSISVLEHIPDAGDTEAIRELVRVVRPRGVVVVTTPFDHRYRETFVDRRVYERSADGAGRPVFFERHYDREALQQRLIETPATRLLSFELWGEGIVRVESALSRLGPMRTPLSPLEPLLAKLALRQTGEHAGHPMAAFFTLQKTPVRSAGS
jgi:SAM-dependent methyltransferase